MTKQQVSGDQMARIAGATFGIGMTMMFENVYWKEQIVALVERIVDLLAPASERVAS